MVENHHAPWENAGFQWPSSMAIVTQPVDRGSHGTCAGPSLHVPWPDQEGPGRVTGFGTSEDKCSVRLWYPLITMGDDHGIYGKTHIISMAIFNSELSNYQSKCPMSLGLKVSHHFQVFVGDYIPNIWVM